MSDSDSQICYAIEESNILLLHKLDFIVYCKVNASNDLLLSVG